MNVLFEILKVIILGIVQGITEWLPISSTGHMIIVNAIIPLKVFKDVSFNKEFVDMFFVLIQLGSIFAVITLYFKKLNPFSKEGLKLATIRLWFKVVVAAIPAVIVGLLFDDYIEALLYTPLVVAITLIVYGFIFIFVERKNNKVSVRTISELSYLDAFKIGLFQVLALVPGTSRSGSTILGAVLIGTSRVVAAEFSFFLAIPMMFGASFLKLIKLNVTLNFYNVILLLIGLFVAYIVSLIAIKSLMKFIKKHNFIIFGYYRIVVGIIVIIAMLGKVI